MLLKESIDIDLYKFITEGTFDCIKIGQNKEWILNNFPDPDYQDDMGHDCYIWSYGNLEFHFEGDELFLIWCDNFIQLDAGKHINLQPWVFQDLHKEDISLTKFINLLNADKISHIIYHDHKIQNAIVRILKSNAEIYFDYPVEKEYEAVSGDDFYLVGFGLSRESNRLKFLP